MKLREVLVLLGGLSILFPVGLSAEEKLDFSSVWEKVMQNSPSLHAKSLEVEAAKSASFRAGLHWFPRLYTDVRSYNTDDPTLNFTGKLGQRSATQSDFSTASTRSNPANFFDSNNQPYQNLNPNSANIFAKDTLNHPGSNTYSRGTLGLEFSVYEGGSQSALKAIREKEWESARLERDYFLKTIFVQTAVAYQASVIYSESIREREMILHQLETFSNAYRLGGAGNQVGQAGLLALKSLKLRLAGELKEYELSRKEVGESIRLLSGSSVDSFEPKQNPLDIFLDDVLPIPFKDEKRITALSKVYESYSEISKQKVKMEDSKFLPKIGLYAEAYGYNGDRNFASSYNAGVYLQMNLLNPTDIGSKKESMLKAEAAAVRAGEVREKENSNFLMLQTKEKTLSQNRKYMDESFRFQIEQLRLSQSLFKMGNIPATILAESFSHTVDALRKKDQLTLEYLKTRAELLLYSEKEHERAE